jgi:prolyl oligopeptidase
MRIALAALLLAGSIGSAPLRAADSTLVYPAAPRGTVTDAYFGTVVADPYRWLEAIDAPATVAWLRAEKTLTRAYLDAIPVRAAISKSYAKFSSVPSQSAPFRAGSRWFFSKNTGLLTQAVIYVRDSEFGPARAFFDPNTLSRDGTTQLAGMSFTRDGSFVGYATQTGGSDWQTWHVKSVATGADRSDRIAFAKYSDLTWSGDRGFYYEGFGRPAGSGDTTFAALGRHKVFFHRLGTPQSADRLVATASVDNVFLDVATTEDGRYVFLERGQGNGNSLAWKTAAEPEGAFKPVFELDPNVEYDLIGADGSRIYLRTDRNAPRFRVVWVDLRDPHHALHDIVAQTADKLEGTSLVGGTLVLSYSHDAHTVLETQPLAGGPPHVIALPGIGTASVASTLRGNPAVYYSYDSYAYPRAIFRYDLQTRKQYVTYRSVSDFRPNDFVTEQLFARSKDGTRVPMFVTHRRDMPYDGTTPTLIYGYGGFDISEQPRYSTRTAMWLRMGGAYADVILRGGGEYGEAWHDAGRLLEKQHVFDDFIAAAQLLIERKITSTPKLAMDGGSNGGLLVGAVLTQRADLFGAAVAEQGVLDMLRYQNFTVGKAWIPEYGSSTASAAQFKALYAYSPVHNVKDGTAYPPTLVTTSDHDDRVFPAHSFKFVAALQHAQSGPNPILLRYETSEGHFSGLSHDRAIALTADFYAFLVQSLGFQPVL